MKRIVFPLLLLAIFSSLLVGPRAGFCQESPDMKEGMKYFYERDFDRASGFFHNEMKRDPANTLGILFLLDCYAQKKNVQPILNELEEAALNDPQSAIIKSNLGMGYFAQSLLKKELSDESLNAFQEALKIDSNLAQGYVGMGIIYYKKRMIPRSRSYFSKALKLNGDDAVALERLGEIFLIDDKNAGAAQSQFARIVELYPSYPDGYFYYASACKELGEIDRALEFYEKTMALDPQGMGKGYYAPVRIGDIYYDNMKNNEKAIEYYQKALKINPDNSYAKRMLNLAKNPPRTEGEKEDRKKKK